MRSPAKIRAAGESPAEVARAEDMEKISAYLANRLVPQARLLQDLAGADAGARHRVLLALWALIGQGRVLREPRSGPPRFRLAGATPAEPSTTFPVARESLLLLHGAPDGTEKTTKSRGRPRATVQVARALAMLAERRALADIAQALGVGRATLCRALREAREHAIDPGAYRSKAPRGPAVAKARARAGSRPC